MKAKQPNVILVITDQQRVDSIGSYGLSGIRTPHLDRMAQHGVRFERAYCANPVCTPSRVSIFSGKSVGHHGCYNVGTTLPESETLMSHSFQRAGYGTHLIGKAHFQPYLSDQSMESLRQWESLYPSFQGPYYGFETIELSIGHSTYGVKGHYGDWVKTRAHTTSFPSTSRADSSFGAEAVDWDIPLELHHNKWVEERSIAFLRSRKERKEPFFLSIGFQDPHHPHAVPRERKKTVRPEELPDRWRGNVDASKPPHWQWLRQGQLRVGHPLAPHYGIAGQGDHAYNYSEVEEQDAIEAALYYYELCTMIDESVGVIMDELERLDLMKDTILVFTSDHGELLGNHGLWLKGPLHAEEVIRVPLLICWENKLPRGTVVSSVVSLRDLAPTLLSLCNLPAIEGMDGKDLSTLCSGMEDENACALVECVDDPAGLRLKTLVTQQWKITMYYGEYGEKHGGELYNLDQDPHEERNLWNDPDAQDWKMNLLLRLLNETETYEVRLSRTHYA